MQLARHQSSQKGHSTSSPPRDSSATHPLPLHLCSSVAWHTFPHVKHSNQDSTSFYGSCQSIQRSAKLITKSAGAAPAARSIYRINVLWGPSTRLQTADEHPPCAAPAAPRRTAQLCWGARSPWPLCSLCPQRRSVARLSAGQSPQPSSSGHPAPAQQGSPLQQQGKVAAHCIKACRLCAAVCTILAHHHHCS